MKSKWDKTNLKSVVSPPISSDNLFYELSKFIVILWTGASFKCLIMALNWGRLYAYRLSIIILWVQIIDFKVNYALFHVYCFCPAVISENRFAFLSITEEMKIKI